MIVQLKRTNVPVTDSQSVCNTDIRIHGKTTSHVVNFSSAKKTAEYEKAKNRIAATAAKLDW
ncbi:TPA: hypothetical protein PXO68_002703 [Yersinia enterocolitica]|uniref:hypothetical protein n=1 Tax=Yersinia ruckeri TaxID=29486 RepID=UPI0005E09167|nr:hypothetical protein [Yersinia ruckeri]CFQ66972.1 Uncharacterised protein [Yersinia frederiksenii]HDL7601069.1 hypothetical protein [Yersinia enterocolitica]CNJ00145.1 Uncharacterised protein [Yersinia frederiksenii]HDL7605327.1 hypothetical protein [Yersinia enterocolitica]HDL7608972.1 hypothetical protein [Yersinia enterocolitica]